jgi:tetratricopeptide (TPR) repeat protein
MRVPRIMRLIGIVSGVLGLALLASPARAASTLYGTTLARSCYESAQAFHADAAIVRICTRALEEEALSPAQRAHTFVNRGVVQILRGDSAAALTDYAAAETVLPGLAEARVNRGLALLRQGDSAAAIAEISSGEAAGCIEPAPCRYALAVAREVDGDLAGAYRALQGALALDADFAPAKRALARFRIEKRGAPGA